MAAQSVKQGAVTIDARRLRWLLSSALLVTVLALTVASYIYLRTAERETLEAQFDQRTAELAGRLERRFDAYVSEVHSLRAFFDSSSFVDRKEFRSFVDPSIKRHPGIQALAWIPRVSREERELFELAAQADGFEAFRFKRWADGGWEAVQEPWSDEYFPVMYTEPVDFNEAALGSDLASNPVRRRALERARDSNDLVATSRVKLIQETGEHAGVLVILPVYARGASSDTLGARRRLLKGFTLGVFHIDGIVNLLLNRVAHKDIWVRIIDTSAPLGEQLLYEEVDSALMTESTLQYIHPLEIGGRTWALQFFASPGYIRSRRDWQPWLILIIGGLLAALIAALFWNSARRAAVVERRVEERTAELSAVNTRLTHATSKLEQSNLELKQFAYIASHDLQSPLRSIGGFASLLKQDYEGQLDESADDYIERIIRSTGRMQTLLHHLLEYSRLDSEIRPFSKVSLNDVYENVLEELRPNVQAIKAEVYRGELPTVLGDEVQLFQLFQNLLGNALKYYKNIPPSISVIAEEKTEMWEIAIKDNGIGIAEQHHDRIFEVFRRLHTQNAYAGTGIGLAICRRIVERHGGTIWLTSQAGKGSTFYFSLKKGD